MKDKYALNKVTWQYIIVDEGHRMKNYKSKFTQTLGTQFNSVYRLLLTGTPLQNNLSELWALLNFLLPKIFNSCDDFEKWFNQPFSSKLPGEKNTELTEEQELLIIHRLHNILRPFLLRREKKEVEKELPSKTEYVIKLQISDWQKIVYSQIKEQGLLAEDPSTGRLGNKALMNTMMQLRKVCNHPYHFIDLNNSMFEHIDEWIIKSSGKFEFLDRIIPKLLYFKHILSFLKLQSILLFINSCNLSIKFLFEFSNVLNPVNSYSLLFLI
jgi:SNF2 family DNA or RNA helicase